MDPNPANKLHGLDHLRAFAILSVFLFHYQVPIFGHPEWLPDVAKFGWTGVDLFFVLSGFLISSQLFSQIKQGQKVSFFDFFRKRFFRIIPAFWVVTGIYFLFPFFWERKSLPPLWRFLTFTQNFGLDISRFGTFSHAWSLCVEEHFYLLLPLILWVVQRMRMLRYSAILLVILFLVGLACRIYSWQLLYFPHINDEKPWLFWYKYLYYPTYNRLDGLLMGVSIAAVYRFLPTVWNLMAKFGNLFILFGVSVLVTAYFLCYDQETFAASVFGFPLVALGYGSVVIGAISSTGFLSRKSKITATVATLSYSVYLTHKGVIHITQQFLADWHISTTGNWALVICMLSCLLAATLLHVAIEMPFLKWRDRLVKQK